MKIVTLFGSSKAQEGEEDYEQARRLGHELAQAGFTVCNGGYGGIMEASARGAKEGRGRTIGVTTKDFGGPANRWIDREIRVKKWSERLFKLIALGDAYVIFDGGTGTLAELFVVWEMLNKKFIEKPVIILGKQSSSLLDQVCRFPQVIRNPNIFVKNSLEEIARLLKENLRG